MLVFYDSQYGYANKMPQFVTDDEGRKISGYEIRLKSVEETTEEDIIWADGVAVGSPTHLGLVSAKMKAFWDGIIDIWGQVEGEIACAFSSSEGFYHVNAI
jgi:NAD(P)H dehydrogenase (quinone)